MKTLVDAPLGRKVVKLAKRNRRPIAEEMRIALENHVAADEAKQRAAA